MIVKTSGQTGGGAIAIRGLLVQTLIALLKITNSDPPFEEITLEPNVGNDQFDFLWKNAEGFHATQVKSTQNMFTKAEVETWAKKLEDAHTTEACTLMLVGNIHPNLAKLEPIGKVALEQKPLDFDGLIAEAAHRLAEFMERAELEAGSAEHRIRTVHTLESKLLHLSTDATVLTRDAFIALLRKWIAAVPKSGIRVDISRIIKYAPAELIGREAETAILNTAWTQATEAENGRPHVLTFVALGGEGKTSLVAKWLADLAAQDWPGCDAVFAWSFYSQGTREQTAVSSDLFLTEALTYFGDEPMAKGAAGAFEKGRRLAQLVGEQRALLILDGLEPLQYPPSSPMPGELKDQGLAALLKGLAAASHGLCIVTTRVALPDLRAFHGKTVREEQLLRLSRAAGVQLLKARGVTGSDLQNLSHTDDAGKKEMLSEFEKLVEDVDGHALTLHIMGSFLNRAFQGDIRRRDRVTFAKASEKTDNGHAFRAMAAYEKWLANDSEEARRELAILSLMGLFERPATADCLQALLKAPAIAGLTEPLVGLPEDDWNGSLTALQNSTLLTVNRDDSGTLLSLDAHPLLREYFAIRVRTGSYWSALFRKVWNFLFPRISEASPAWCAAHRRLYEHLCATTTDKPNATLEDLQPLYQAVAHGCQAGLYAPALSEVYRDRILRGQENYSTFKLGAIGSDLSAIDCFFEQPWSRVSPALSNDQQAWLLNEAAYTLRALGRLTEALEPMRAGLENRIEYESWKNAARSASSLSELELTLGEVGDAVGYAEQAVSYADRRGDAFLQMANRTTLADALHQAGRWDEAETRFREAEQMQAERRTGNPQLYSLAGFRYCDLLLTAAERASGHIEGQKPRDEWLEQCRAVSERAAQTLTIARRNNWLLDIALAHLTLGRAALYATILERRESFRQLERQNNEGDPNEDTFQSGLTSALQIATKEIEEAVAGIRRAGQMDELPKALLTRAWQRSLTGPRTGPESAQSDLDEAWEIAARGPMPLFLADIHLYRARLFFREAHYPFTNPDGTPRTPQQDLADARRLIEKHGYGRRLPELEDAEAAINRPRE